MSERPGSSPRRIVAAHDAAGKATITADEPAPKLATESGMDVWQVWAADGQPRLGDGDPPAEPSFFPAPNGSRVYVSDMAADGGRVDVSGRMHATATIDFAFVVSGSVCLTQGDGTEVTLNPGECLIQTGTLHGWHNPGSEPARVVFVLLGAEVAPAA
ncbi:MAG: cupin domain-containing protein [Solirubrobacterales bacterium]